MKAGAAARKSVLPPFDCVCATVRRAARLLTQLYDEELRPRVEVTQFALLSAIEQRPGCRQSALARAAAFDKTTLSRNVARMRRNGWIEHVPADDQREQGLRLTPAGSKLLRTARPGWSRAQERFRAAMSAEDWDRMWCVLHTVTTAAYEARTKKGVSS